MALMPAVSFAASATEDTVVVEGGFDNAQDPSSSQDTDYSVKTTTTGTKLLLVPAIFRSPSASLASSVWQIRICNPSAVLTNTTGVTAQVQDSDRTVFYSRGFFVSNYAYDDLPTSISEVWNFGDTAADTAIYDRIEVVRGATGLMSGTEIPPPTSTWYVSMQTAMNLKAMSPPVTVAGTNNATCWICRLRW